jgi:hypothetical protein
MYIFLKKKNFNLFKFLRKKNVFYFFENRPILIGVRMKLDTMLSDGKNIKIINFGF